MTSCIPKYVKSKLIRTKLCIRKKILRNQSIFKNNVNISANFIKQDGELSFVEENVVFGFIAGVRGEVLSDNAVPISPVLLVKLFLDVFRHEILDLDVVNGVLGLTFN
jgi:hypothetical protein